MLTSSHAYRKLLSALCIYITNRAHVSLKIKVKTTSIFACKEILATELKVKTNTPLIVMFIFNQNFGSVDKSFSIILMLLLSTLPTVCEVTTTRQEYFKFHFYSYTSIMILFAAATIYYYKCFIKGVQIRII